jgi:hypothetical protein
MDHYSSPVSFRRLFRSALVVLFLGACIGEQVDAGEWRAMDAEARLLYVKALLGEEQVKEAKGGNAVTFPAAAETYVARIEAAYARGDVRHAEQIFAELGTKK